MKSPTNANLNWRFGEGIFRGIFNTSTYKIPTASRRYQSKTTEDISSAPKEKHAV